jgi:hypothetical protein
MGVRRLFSRGGQKFFKGGARAYFLPEKQQKGTIFPKKSKNILFFGRPWRARGGGQEPPLPSPADAHVYNNLDNINRLLPFLFIPPFSFFFFFLELSFFAFQHLESQLL